jgi:hypothetical protein
LQPPLHKYLLAAFLLLVDAFTRGTDDVNREIYVANTSRINNWDLVDSSAPQIGGAWLLERNKAPFTGRTWDAIECDARRE